MLGTPIPVTPRVTIYSMHNLGLIHISWVVQQNLHGMRACINSGQIWPGLPVTSTSATQTAMSDDEPETSGRCKRVDGLQLGPRKRPYIHHLHDGFYMVQTLTFTFLKGCY